MTLLLEGDVVTLPERVKRELIRGEHARAEFAIRAQTALKETMDQMGPYRHIDGLGVKRATIHPDLAARIRVKFGMQALHDPEFLRALLRDNPFLRVQCAPGRLTLRVNGMRDRTHGTHGSECLESVAARRSAGSLDSARDDKEFQNGHGHGGPGDPGPAPTRAARPGFSLSLERGSAHETPAYSGKRRDRLRQGYGVARPSVPLGEEAMS